MHCEETSSVCIQSRRLTTDEKCDADIVSEVNDNT